ncbi:MAG: hypothetical protein LUH00_02135 [Lachnospiraceae bacterium]|nr:hypothetical protein [Lachnospiraceae bacterium]
MRSFENISPQQCTNGAEKRKSVTVNVDVFMEKQRTRRKRTIGKTILVLAVFAALLVALDLALYPCTFIRSDIHAISTTQYDDIIVGDSHGKMNIDPDAMEEVTGRSGHNVCVGGEYGIDAYYLVKLAAEKQNPTRVIYEISPGYFVTEKEEGNNYLLFYHEFPLSWSKVEYFFDAIAQTNFRTVLFPWYEYSLSYEVPLIAETLTHKLTGDYSIDSETSTTQVYHESGFIERYAVDTSALQLTEPILYEEGAIVEENMEYLKKTIEFCRENGIEFVAVTTPIPAATLGTWWDNFEAAWEYFEAFFEEEDVTYLNFNTDYYFSFSHEIEDYTDYDGHMNGNAAREFSRVLAELLSSAEE